MTAIICNDILFDLDGTLVDTRDAVTECYRRVFGQEIEENFMVEALPGHDLFAMRPYEVFSKIKPDMAEILYASYQKNYPNCTDYIKVFSGIAELLNELVNRGRRLSIVTNKGLERTLIDLSVAGVSQNTFAAVVTAEDTIKRKPDPAPLLLGLERAGAVAADAVYVGDGPQDILAAKAANMRSVGITYGFYESEQLKPLEPTVLVNSVAQLATALGLRDDVAVEL